VSDEAQEEGRPTGWRKALAILLVALYGLMAAATYLVSQEGFRLYHEVKAPMPFLALQACRFVEIFQRAWPIYGLALGSLAVLSLTGFLDKIVKPLTVLALLMCLGTILMGAYIHFLPQILFQHLCPRPVSW